MSATSARRVDKPRISRGLVFAASVLLSMMQLAADCVDGVTPDCSDAAAKCGPSLDGSTDSPNVLPEASTDGGDADAPDDATPDRDAAADG
jgi:hypothetical protein